MMEDKGTSVGLDISEDIIKVRLPFLENELSTVNQPYPGLQRSQSMLPSSRFSYITPRQKHLDRSKPSTSDSKQSSQAGKVVQDNDEKHEHLPALSKSATRVMYSDRNLFLDGTQLANRSTTQTPRDKEKGQNRIATMYCINNAGAELFGKPNLLPLHRTRSELEIIEQAKQMLVSSGFEDGKLLQNDLEKLGKGISSMYMSDFGLHGERVAENSGMSLQKRLLPSDHIEEEVQNMAHKHIYMCQIPSLITRNSPARRSVTNFRKTMLPHGYRRGLQSMAPFDRNDNSRRGRRGITSPRKPMVMVSEKSTLYELPLSRRTPFNSMENLTLGSNTERYQAPGIDIQGTPVSVYATTKRIL